MAERQLIIFARPARLGAVKSRLAKDIGVLAAWRFYRRTLAGLIAEVGGDQRWHTTLSVTRGAVRWPGGLARAAQGRGDLGARMLAAMRAQAPGPVAFFEQHPVDEIRLPPTPAGDTDDLPDPAFQISADDANHTERQHKQAIAALVSLLADEENLIAAY